MATDINYEDCVAKYQEALEEFANKCDEFDDVCWDEEATRLINELRNERKYL
jgi:hypothetical protein